MNKIGVMLEAFHTDIPTAISLARKAGAEGVQFYAGTGPLDCDRCTAEDRRAFYRSLLRNDLEISALCADLGGHGFTRPAGNLERLEKTGRMLAWANELGCHTATTHLGVIPDGDGPVRRTLKEACLRLNELGERYDVHLAIETGPEPIAVLSGFLEETGCPFIGINYDPANLVMVTGDDPVAGVAAAGSRIVHTHVKDGKMLKKTDPEIIYRFLAEGGIEDFRLGDYFQETPLMEGQVDLPAWYRALKAAGYTGYLTIERETAADPGDSYREILRCIEVIRSFSGC